MVNIVICDDEADFGEIASCKIQNCFENTLHMEYTVSVFDNLKDLNRHLSGNRTDILFLDIMMNGTNAMDWSIENIRSAYTQIIFMTAYPQSAYNISESNCCYYMVKSRMNDESLARAIRRALQRITKKDPNMTVVKSGSKNYAVNLQDIMFIESLNNNITLNMRNGERLTVYASLREFAEKLPIQFLRCHQSYMVNMNHITSYEAYGFILNGASRVPIPPKRYKNVVAEYKNYLTNL